ncbi:UNVERIFIED_CONTAM: hypothetical protein Sradi_6729000 [Sesamum radiatum]|uniref:Uncharacterized protein n=1 Tax=Sesamum radiatum TaxID=300843 RepID=A0AAW2JRM0_SESRA
MSKRVGPIDNKLTPTEFQTQWWCVVLTATSELLHRYGGGRQMLGIAARSIGIGLLGYREPNATRVHIGV